MNELTLTQLGTVVGLLYTLWQFSQAKSAQIAEIAGLSARMTSIERNYATQEQAVIRIERSVNQLVTAVARLDERLTALDTKLDAKNKN